MKSPYVESNYNLLVIASYNKYQTYTLWNLLRIFNKIKNCRWISSYVFYNTNVHGGRITHFPTNESFRNNKHTMDDYLDIMCKMFYDRLMIQPHCSASRRKWKTAYSDPVVRSWISTTFDMHARVCNNNNRIVYV